MITLRISRTTPLCRPHLNLTVRGRLWQLIVRRGPWMLARGAWPRRFTGPKVFRYWIVGPIAIRRYYNAGERTNG